MLDPGDAPRLALSPEDKARAAAAVGLTGGTVLAALLLAAASGLALTPPTLAVGALAGATALACGRVAAQEVESPLELYAADAQAMRDKPRPFISAIHLGDASRLFISAIHLGT